MRGVKKVLVPTDLSENSRRGVRNALSLAAENGAELLVLHVAREFQAWELYPDEMGFIDRPPCRWTADRVVQEATLDLHRFLERHLDEVRRVSAVRKRVVLGDVIERITEVAQEEQSDLIVMSPRPHGTLRRLFLGSVTDRVTRKAPCPVLSLCQEKQARPFRGKPIPAMPSPLRSTETKTLNPFQEILMIGKILCPTDFSENSKRGVAYAISLAREHQAELILFYVTSFPIHRFAYPCELDPFVVQSHVSRFTVDDLFREESCRVGHFIDVHFGQEIRGLKWKTKIGLGKIADEIVCAAIEEEVDLVVMARRKRSSLARLLFRSTSEAVSHEAPCPVLSMCSSQILGPTRGRQLPLARGVLQAEPYLLPSLPGVETVSILTVGDSINGYRMVGNPDGLGAFHSHGNEFTLLMNHEIAAARPGIVRAHGSNGAFVSRWTIDRKTLKVLKGEDLTPSASHVFLWDPVHNEYTQGTTQWQRLCSADLPVESALFANGRGTRERIFFNGEEVTDAASARAWARIATGPHAGEAWQLPRFGRMSYENAVACPQPQDKTIVVLLDDGDLSTAATSTGFPSEVYVYIGTKQKQGHPIEQAGLLNGSLYGVKVWRDRNLVTEESNDFGLGTAATGFVGKARFTLHNLGDVSKLTVRQFQDASILADIMRFQRPQDGAWDPRKKYNNDFYFVTTADIDTNCRLWRLRFDNIEHPENGGTMEILLKGDEGHRMLDNVTIDHHGRILMDEDPSHNSRVPKIWLYHIATGELVEVARHNPKFFDPTIHNNSAFITHDEESSGIIDAEHILGEGRFLLDVQAHQVNTADPELVEGGQLLAMFVDPRIGGENDDHHGHDDDDRDHHDRD